jgi:hypothetical protein
MVKVKSQSSNKKTNQKSKNEKLELKQTIRRNIIEDPFIVFQTLGKLIKDDFSTGDEEEEKKKKNDSDSEDDIVLDDENHDYQTSKSLI